MTRERYIDIAKGIGIVLVVYGHIINNLGLSSLSSVSAVIYSFHMPLFFMISGYCIGLKSTKNLVDVNPWIQIKKLFLRLMVPYFVWSFVYMYIGGLLSNPERYKAVFTLRGIAPLWFLATLFMCEVFFWLFISVTRKISLKKSMVIISVITILFFGAGFALFSVKDNAGLSAESMGVSGYYTFVTFARFFVSMGVFLAGYIFAKLGFIKKVSKIVGGFAGAFLIFLSALTVVMTELKVNLHIFEISNYFLFIVVAVSASLGVVLISRSLENALKFMAFMGQNSLGIMVLHYLPFKAMSYSEDFAGLISDNEIIISIVAFLVTSGFALMGAWLIKKKFFIYK